MRYILILILMGLAGLVEAADNKGAAPAASAASSAAQTYTIFCMTFSGKGHIEQAKSLRDKMIKSTDIKDWYVVSTTETSTLYYGYYTTIDEKKDPKEAARAQKDRKAVGDIQSNGKPMFMPLLLTVEEADPAGKPEWDLRNAKGFWSLQIAAFKDDPHRKTSAVQAVAELRKEGVDAFFYHGPTVSSVCVGSFPESAATVTEGPDVKPSDSAVLVAPSNIPLPDKTFRTRDGQPILVKQPKIIITDPEFKALMAKYPNHATDGVEGREFTVRGQKVPQYDPSVPVKIPKNEGYTATAPKIPTEVLAPTGGGSKPASGGAKPAGSTGGTTPKNPPSGGKLPGLDF